MIKSKVYISLIIFQIFISCTDAYIPKVNREYVPGEIVKIKHTKGVSVRVKYKIKDGSEIIGYSIDGIRKLQLGEWYWIAYDSTVTNSFSIFYTAPYIADSSNYTQRTAIIENVESIEKYNQTYVSFIYKIEEDEIYRRFQRLPSTNIKKGDKVKIIVNRKNQRISYVKGYSQIIN